MNKLTTKLYIILQALREEHGQDLIEYVLIGGVVAVASVVAMTNFAGQLNTAFVHLGNKLTTYTS